LIRRRKLIQLYDKEKDEFDYELTKIKGNEEILERYRQEQHEEETSRIATGKKNEVVLPVIKTNNKLSPKLKKKIAGYDIVNNANFSLKKDSTPVDFFTVNKQLDQSINKYNNHLEKLKIDDFLTRKKMQDELLNKISFKMEKIKLGLNDKTYFQDMNRDWYRELKLNK
jgi:hypothetical protein